MKIKPQPGPQTQFLASTASICVYGGAAGGGKTYGLLLDPLRYLFTEPGFSGVVFRRTFPEIVLPGALWDTSLEVYGPLGATPRIGNLDWTFPPYGNRISFHHLQHDSDRQEWQGSQVTYFGIDELTHFNESAILYIIFSRARSSCRIPSYTRCTCNPDPGWCKDFLAPWVDQEFKGKPAKSGEIRWFIRSEGKMQWVPKGTLHARSLTFIGARLEDNPILLRNNPEYISSLKALNPVDYRRLYLGDWNVRRSGLVYPDFDSCLVDTAFEPCRAPTHGGIDFGWNNPFASPRGYLDHDDVLWITGNRQVSFQTLPTHSQYLPPNVRWWADPSQPGLIAELRHAGHDVRPCVHVPTRGASGEKKSPILSGIDMVNRRIQTKRLKIVRNLETMSIVRELANYHYDEDKSVEEPVKENDHACFPAGTLIATSLGNVPIEQIEEGDRVLTRSGWYSVACARLSGINQPLWRARFSDGRTLTATPDHPIWVENRGWIRLDALRYLDTIDTLRCSIVSTRSKACRETEVRSTQTTVDAKRCLSRGSSIAVIPTETIGPIDRTSLQPVACDCTALSGLALMDQSLTGTTSITPTTTHPITLSIISNASPRLSITLCMPQALRTNKDKPRGTTLTESASLPPSGMAPRKGGPGTSNMANVPGRAEKLPRRPASIAASLIQPGMPRRPLDSARSIAECTHAKKEAMITKSELVRSAIKPSRLTGIPGQKPALVSVVSVSDLGQRSDVYALTVDGPHEFYANGVLVKNCDALRYLITGLDRGSMNNAIHLTDAEYEAKELTDRQADFARRQAEDARREQEIWNPDRWGDQ